VPKQKNERTVILKADGQTIILNLGPDRQIASADNAMSIGWDEAGFPRVARLRWRSRTAAGFFVLAARPAAELLRAIFGTTETTLQRL
jgi:hypothetical protein